MVTDIKENPTIQASFDMSKITYLYTDTSQEEILVSS